jgi:hypothetical protein
MLHIMTHPSQPLEPGQKNISTFFGGNPKMARNTADDTVPEPAPKREYIQQTVQVVSL